MAALTDYLETELIKHIFRTGSFTKPTVLAIGLFTAAPGETGGGTEVSGGSYARVQLNPLDANWAATAGGNATTSNSSAVTFPAPTANWGVVTHFGIFDAASRHVKSSTASGELSSGSRSWTSKPSRSFASARRGPRSVRRSGEHRTLRTIWKCRRSLRSFAPAPDEEKTNVIDLLIYLLIFVLIAGLIYWLITQIPLPEPIRRFATIAFVVICSIALIYLLMGFLGMGPRWNLR